MGHWNRVSRVKSRTKAMLDGWTAEAAAMPESYWVGGESLAAADIIARLKQHRRAHDHVGMCRTMLTFAIAQRDEQLDAEQKLQENLTALLLQALGPNGRALRRFGVAPPKARRKLTAEEQVIAQQRSRDTRLVRGTKGSRQREAITTEPQPTVVVGGVAGAPSVDAGMPQVGESSAVPASGTPLPPA